MSPPTDPTVYYRSPCQKSSSAWQFMFAHAGRIHRQRLTWYRFLHSYPCLLSLVYTCPVSCVQEERQVCCSKVGLGERVPGAHRQALGGQGCGGGHAVRFINAMVLLIVLRCTVKWNVYSSGIVSIFVVGFRWILKVNSFGQRLWSTPSYLSVPAIQ